MSNEAVAMFTNQEIQKICEDHKLSRGEVYKIRTAYGSMCQMSETWLDTQGIKNRSERSNKGSDSGIIVEYFVKNCWYLKACLESINRRLLMAAGK